jgi:hypothetical protein
VLEGADQVRLLRTVSNLVEVHVLVP